MVNLIKQNPVPMNKEINITRTLYCHVCKRRTEHLMLFQKENHDQLAEVVCINHHVNKDYILEALRKLLIVSKTKSP
jgi:hypothetical protein